MKKEEHIKYWLDTAEDDLITADSLFLSKRYTWCLFIGHLVIEKTLKAYFVNKHNTVPPKIHDLIRLANLSNLTLTNDHIDFLEELNLFNLETRYPDYKNNINLICNFEFTEKMFNKIKEHFQWLKSQMKY